MNDAEHVMRALVAAARDGKLMAKHQSNEGDRAKPGLNYGEAGGPRLRLVALDAEGQWCELYIRWSKAHDRLIVETFVADPNA